MAGNGWEWPPVKKQGHQKANGPGFRVMFLLYYSCIDCTYKRCNSKGDRYHLVVLANCGSDHSARSRHLGLRLGYSKR